MMREASQIEKEGREGLTISENGSNLWSTPKEDKSSAEAATENKEEGENNMLSDERFAKEEIIFEQDTEKDTGGQRNIKGVEFG